MAAATARYWSVLGAFDVTNVAIVTPRYRLLGCVPASIDTLRRSCHSAAPGR
jgi:hypothetical protein